MPKPRHLRRAPITEAIFDIRVKSRKGMVPGALTDLVPAFKQAFPIVEEQRRVEAIVEFDADVVKQHEMRNLGIHALVLKSEDTKTVVQLRVDGFSMNRLRPYSSWDELQPEFWAAWKSYRDLVAPDGVNRVAMRFINHITLPDDVKDFDDYLLAAPRLPEEVPQYTAGFFTQILMHDPDRTVDATVRQSLESDHGRITVLLDIDAYKIEELEIGSPRIEDTFQRLHDYKNAIFFGSLTEKTLELFQ